MRDIACRHISDCLKAMVAIQHGIDYINYHLFQTCLELIYPQGGESMRPRSHIARSAADVGHLLNQARWTKRLSQSQLSKICGIGQDTISRLERGSPASQLDTVFRLIEALDLDIIITDRSKVDEDELERVF